MPHIIKFNIKITLILLTLIASNLYAATNNNIDYATVLKSFTIPGRGELTMNVPRVWDYNFTITDADNPPLITFYNLDKNEEEIFQLNMSVLWDDGFRRNITSPEYIRSLVKETGKKTLIHSDQSELTLNEITGTNGNGYLFDLTDSNAGQGEYQFLTQGALAVGKLLLIFSLFSNDDKSILREAMLRTIMSAQHHHRKDV